MIRGKTDRGMITARRVLAAIQTLKRETGRVPTLREIESATGMPVPTVRYGLNVLRHSYGYVRWEKYHGKRMPRALRVTEDYS